MAKPKKSAKRSAARSKQATASRAKQTATGRTRKKPARTAHTGRSSSHAAAIRATARYAKTGAIRSVTVKPEAPQLFPVPVEVERLITALGSNTVADLLGVSRSQPGRWLSGEDRISPANRARLTDLDHVVSRLLQVLWPAEAGAWLTAFNPHVGGRPVDVLALRGAAPVIDAIDALAQGAFA